MDETRTISLLRTGDREAFREVTEMFRDRVYNTALGIVRQEDDAGDITQEVFIEVYRSIGAFRGESSLSTWIYRIAVGKSLEHLRRMRRRKRSAMVLSLFGMENTLPASNTPFYHPGVCLENKERAAILFSAIGRLPENQQVAFTLHKLENLSYSEITGVMDLTLSAVESLIFRARQNLQKMLSDYYEKNEK